MNSFSNPIVLTSALISIFLCSCGGKSERESPALPQSSANATTPQPPVVIKPFSIKGFYIGMPLDEARKLASDRLAEIGVTEPTISKFYGPHVGTIFDGFTMSVSDPHSLTGSEPLVGVVADTNERVIHVTFAAPFVDASFNVRDLNSSEFVKEIVQHYGIPEMEPLRNGEGYFYVDTRAGFEVRSIRKSLSLSKIRKQAISRQQNSPCSIEGIRIGMSFGEAQHLASELVAKMGAVNPTTEFRNYRDDQGVTIHNHAFAIRAHIDSEAGLPFLLHINADTDDRVTSVLFEPLFMSHLFNDSFINDFAERLDVSEVAREAMGYYGITSMEPMPYGYYYKEPDAGIELSIGQRGIGGAIVPVLSLRKITKPTERHFEP
jgi:hypothetical protein